MTKHFPHVEDFIPNTTILKHGPLGVSQTCYMVNYRHVGEDLN